MVNIGDVTAHDIVADATLSTGGEIIWSGSEEVGVLAPGESYRTDVRVELSYEDGLKVVRNDNVVTVQMVIRADEGDVIFRDARDVDTLERVDLEPPRLESGSIKRVSVDGETYYLISELPGQPPNREAVTTTDYELVELELAERVIGHEMWDGMTWDVDWHKQIEKNKALRQYSQDQRTLGRAIELGWNITEIMILSSAGVPSASIGTVVDVTTDTIDWVQKDVEKPYREAFQRFDGCLRNSDQVWGLASQMTSYQTMGDTLGKYLDGLMALDGAIDEGMTLSRAWAHVFRQGVSSGAWSSLSYAAKESSGFFIGFVVSSAVGELENVVRLKSNIHGVDHAYATTRLPVLERLQELHERIVNGTHRTGDGIEYYLQLQTNFQMTALAYAANSKYWQQISNSTTGIVWDVVADAQQKADKTENLSKRNADTFKTVGRILGTAMSAINERTRQSINANVDGGTSRPNQQTIPEVSRPMPRSYRDLNGEVDS